MAHDRSEEAAQVLAALDDTSVDDARVAAQLNEIRFWIDYEREHGVKWRDIFTSKTNENGETKTVRRLVLGAGTQALQQFGGINIVSYYLPTVLMESVGLSNERARLLTACNSVSYLIFAGLAVTVVERWGRRGLMLVSTFGQFLTFLIITVLLRFAETAEDGDKYGTASIAFFFLYFISFGMGMLGVPWLYPTEINSLPMRTKGTAVATGTNW